jgi:hypothetical protein
VCRSLNDTGSPRFFFSNFSRFPGTTNFGVKGSLNGQTSRVQPRNSSATTTNRDHPATSPEDEKAMMQQLWQKHCAKKK